MRYDRFSGIDGIYLADVPEPAAGPGQVVVRVEAGALNPGALPALHGSSYTPGRDLAGEVVAIGADVPGFAVGDAVLGRLQSWDAHAQFVAVPADQLVCKPHDLSWDVAGSLCTTPMAGLGATRAVEPRPGETIVISGASGGVGFTAAQLALRAGARVIGLAGDAHFDLLRHHGVEPVRYGDGEQERILAATDRADAFIDTVGGGYLDLAIDLGVPADRIDTVVDYRGAKEKGVKSLGTTDAGGLPALAELATLAATGDLHIPIAATYPLTAVRDAYQALTDRKTHGRIVLHPQDLS
ncbi:NADPH:quinone reductase and related Zn-dependent oxidoreductase [Amycolatopsis mediterranei S699]|uniref:NADPH:quinone reductase and related Zn-dependent oxidoreductase n=1 Tax=Amycolatopsis mediterranei (strain S699) TaxID=713604 RepID=A0A9R0NWY7_AMYMS|nr:NADPH:quinone reductase and related Zn-dependent oxidoreductase [Amycolatopsis mediterranei S699]